MMFLVRVPLCRRIRGVSSSRWGARRGWLPYVLSVLLGITTTSGLAVAQEKTGNPSIEPNPSYDGRFTFARLRYGEDPKALCTGFVGNSRGAAGWQHDYPEGERDLLHIMSDVTTLNAWTDSSAAFRTDDPQLMRYPILYLTEPACWHPSESEVQGLRTYLLKGGFLIVDDFAIGSGGAERYAKSRRVFEEEMRRVLPNCKFVPLALTDPALNGFFRLNPEALTKELQRASDLPLQVIGIYEEDDPKKRLLVVANYNTAIHRSWVWEAEGLTSVQAGNEAYKLGVNYLLYGLSH